MADNDNGKIVWGATLQAHLQRVIEATRVHGKRWWRDVTHWQPVRRYTNFQVYFDTPANDESEASE
jgi:hypothetical protein